MDNNTVFIKTREGEDAVRQRTRLVQRNLRNILIMVDGSATVADLSRRFGDPNVAQAALAELAAGGFISEVATASPSSGDREERAEDVPVLTSAIASRPAGKPLPSREPPPPPEPEPEPEPIPSDFHEYESIQPSLGVAEARQAPPTQPAATGWLDKLKGLLPAGKGKPAPKKAEPDVREEAQAAESVKPEPTRRRKAFSINGPLLALSSVAGLIVLALLAALLFPYGRYLPEIEKKAATLLKEPVKIGDVGFSFLPRPHIYLSNIKVGQDEFLTVAVARAMPEFMSLTRDTTIISELIMEKTDVNSRGLGRLAQAGASQGIEIRHISMNNLSLIVGDRVIDRLNGEVMMSSGAPEKILLANADGTFKLEMKPKKDGYHVAAYGRNWTTPFSPGLLFQTVDMQGELTSSRLSLTKIDGRAYGGLVEGKALLDWTERNAMLSGDLDITRTSAAKVLAALGTDLSAEGELTARVGLNAKADNLDKLAEALRADGSFEIKRGAAKGFDLDEAMRNTGRTPTRGGVTKFEQLNGTFLFDSQGCRLGNLRLGSGLFKAGGNLGIARNAQLSGVVDVELKGTAATMKIPLTVSGTTKEPLLTPSRGR